VASTQHSKKQSLSICLVVRIRWFKTGCIAMPPIARIVCMLVYLVPAYLSAKMG